MAGIPHVERGGEWLGDVQTFVNWGNEQVMDNGSTALTHIDGIIDLIFPECHSTEETIDLDKKI